MCGEFVRLRLRRNAAEDQMVLMFTPDLTKVSVNSKQVGRHATMAEADLVADEILDAFVALRAEGDAGDLVTLMLLGS
jgi:hypothetical protein